LVIYHGQKKWSSGVRLSDLIYGPKEKLNRYIPDFEFVLYDLTRYSDNEIKGGVVLSAFLLLLKYLRSREAIEKLPAIISLLMELEKQDTGMRSLKIFLAYLFNASDNISEEEFMNIMEKSMSNDKGGAIMTLAEQFFAKGERKGLIEGERKGKLEGKAEGKRETLLRILEEKYGSVPQWYQSKVMEAGIDQVEAWILRAIKAPDLEAVFGEV
jgi:hypothetical protein